MLRLALTFLGGFKARLGPGSPLALPAKVQALLACLARAPASPTPWFQLDCAGFVRFTADQARSPRAPTVGSRAHCGARRGYRDT